MMGVSCVCLGSWVFGLFRPFFKISQIFWKTVQMNQNLRFLCFPGIHILLPSFWAKSGYSRIKIDHISDSLLKLQIKIGVHLMNIELSQLLTPLPNGPKAAKSQLLLHKNVFLRDFYVMTLPSRICSKCSFWSTAKKFCIILESTGWVHVNFSNSKQWRNPITSSMYLSTKVNCVKHWLWSCTWIGIAFSNKWDVRIVLFVSPSAWSDRFKIAIQGAGSPRAL